MTTPRPASADDRPVATATANAASTWSRPVWLGLAGLVGLHIAYPLAGPAIRTPIVLATVIWGFAVSLTHAALSRGARAAGTVLLVAVGGGFTVEAIGVATGFPFGQYAYSDALGPVVLGVPVVVPLAWAWMAWPAWLVSGRLVRGHARRVVVAAFALASWDLFLDPQMVRAGYWHWVDQRATVLPGVGTVPVGNYLGWLGVALCLMTLMSLPSPATNATGAPAWAPDLVMYAMYLWVYGSSVLAHAVFLRLPASALWGALGMGTVALPLAWRLVRQRRRQPEPRPERT